MLLIAVVFCYSVFVVLLFRVWCLGLLFNSVDLANSLLLVVGFCGLLFRCSCCFAVVCHCYCLTYVVVCCLIVRFVIWWFVAFAFCIWLGLVLFLVALLVGWRLILFYLQ